MSTAYLFRDVYLQFFDIQTIPNFLQAPDSDPPSPDFKFLTGKRSYNFRQSQLSAPDAPATGFRTPSFVIQPYPSKQLKSSHFWTILTACLPEGVSYWDAQIPFYLRLLKNDLCLAPGLAAPTDQVEVDTFLWLSAIGWSCHVKIRLRTNKSTDQLAAFSEKLRDRNNNAFLLNGRPISLKGIFELYANALVNDGFIPARNHVQAENFWHQAFVDIIRVGGMSTSLSSMKPLDLNKLLKVLFPRHPPVKPGGSLSQVPNLLVTDVDPDNPFHNFSLTDFNAGSFTFLQAEALQSGREAPLMCYAHNTADCFCTCLTWLNYIRLIDVKTASPLVKRLVTSGKALLHCLSQRFHNRTCVGMFKNHADFLKFIP